MYISPIPQYYTPRKVLWRQPRIRHRIFSDRDGYGVRRRRHSKISKSVCVLYGMSENVGCRFLLAIICIFVNRIGTHSIIAYTFEHQTI